MKKLLSAVFIMFIITNNFVFSSDTKTPVPYGENEFSGFAKDLRRAEIITLGAMPFMTFNVALCYSIGKYAYNGFDYDYFPNPFSKSSDSANAYSTDEQIGIILTSLGLSLGIGITDLIVHSAKRSRAEKRKKLQSGPIQISPLDEEAVKILPPLPKDEEFSENIELSEE